MANEFVVKNGLITPTVQLPGATSGTITISAPAVAGTTSIALPATAGTIVTTGDTGTVTNTMLAGSIANNKLANSTISGTALGGTLPTLTLGVSGTGLSGSTTYNATGTSTFTVTSNATSANTVSTLVARDASGDFSAGTITASLNGNASTASTLQTARTITLSGDVAGSVSFNGSTNVSITTTIQPDSVTLGVDTTGNYVATVAVSGTGLSVSGSGVESAAVTITSNATSANTASTIVARDASGNFTAGTITAALSGNATTATTLQTARTISLTGDVTGSVSFDGSGNAAIATTIQPDSVALGTDTTGNYMVNVAAGTGVSVSHTQGEGSTATVSIGQAVGTTDNVTFNNVTVNGTLTSDDITSTNISVAGNATITGNLTVSGTTTTVNSTTVSIADVNIELARNATSAAQANGAGITVTGPTTAATFTYTSADDRWNLNKNLNVTTVYGALSGNASTASTWQTARTLSLAGDLSGSVSINGGADATLTATIVANSVALGTDTTGNYVADITAGNAITVSGGGAENATITVNHADTSSVANQSAATNTFVSGITFDTYGHVQTITTGSPSGFLTTSGKAADSELLDGQDSTGFLRLLSGGAEASIDSYTDNGFRSVSYTGHSKHMLSWNAGGSTGTVQQEFFYNTPSNGWRVRNKTDNTTWSAWGNVVMASANQGLIGGTIYHSGNLTNLNQLTNGPGYITGYTETDTLATVVSRGASTSTSVTLSGQGNQFGGHFYFLPYDAAGNHYPHFNDGGNAAGSKVNWRLYTGGTNSITHLWRTDYTYFANRVESASDMRATLFYDASDTNYYVDPASTSRVTRIAFGTNSNQVNVNYDQVWRPDAGILYLQSSAAGNLSLVEGGGSVYVGGTIGGKFSIRAGGAGGVGWSTGFNIGDSSNYLGFIQDGGVSRWRNFGTGGYDWYNSTGATQLMILNNSGDLTTSSSMRSPIFYDHNDTAYFCDPNSRSRLSSIDYGNSGYYFAGGDWGFRHNTPHGWIQFGPANTGHAHIYTDRSNFYLNVHDLYLNGNAVPAYGYNRGGNLYASIFYDSNDTTYYIDPAQGGFNLRGGSSNRVTYYTDDSGIKVANAEGTGHTIRLGAAWSRTGIYNGTYLDLGAETNVNFRIANSEKGTMDSSANLFAYGSMRSPIFYDYNDTSYYVDPNGYSRLGALNLSHSRFDSTERYPVGHYSSGETVFEIDPTWNNTQLQAYFNSANVTWVADSTAPGGYAIQIVGNTNVGGAYDSGFPYIPVEQDDIFYMECWIKDVTGTNGHYMGSIDYNHNLSSLGGNPGSYGYWVMGNSYPGTSWTKYGAYITGFGTSTGQFVSGTKYWTPQALFNYSGGGTSYISGWKVTKANKRGRQIIQATGLSGGTSTTYQLQIQNSTGASTSPDIVFGADGSYGYIQTFNSKPLLINNQGNYAQFTDVRSPIFYDSNDTGFFADPAGDSKFRTLQFRSGSTDGAYFYYGNQQNLYLRGNSGSDVGLSLFDSAANWRVQLYGSSGNYGFLNGNWASWDIRKVPSAELYLNNQSTYYINGSEIFYNRVYGATDMRSPIFYNYTDTGYYFDGDSTSKWNESNQNGWHTFNNYGTGVTGTYSSYRLQTVFAMGSVYRMATDGSATNNMYGLAWSHPDAGSLGGANNLNDHGLLIINNGTFRAALSSRAVFSADVRGTLFYDYNDTGYYCDPNGTSRLNDVYPNQIYNYGWFRNQSSANGLYNTANDSHFYSAGPNYWHINPDNGDATVGGLIFYNQYNSTQANATGRKGYVYWDSSGFGLLDSTGTWTVNLHPTNYKRVTIGGNNNNNPYNSVDGIRLMFGGGDDNASGAYYIGTNFENYGGNYTKLDLRWHTGIRMGAQPGYGGIRFYNDESLGTIRFSINKGDAHTRVESGDFYAGNLIDRDNTAYYVDPANVGPSAALASSIYLGEQSTDTVLWDYVNGGSYRPGIQIRGQYPHIDLVGTVANGNHGPTLRFAGYDSGSSGNYKHWVIGTASNALTFLDIGFDSNASNPHEGISGYSGTTLIRATTSGYVGIGGNWGPYGSNGNPSYPLHVIGTGYSNSDFRAPIFYDSASTSYFLDMSVNGGTIMATASSADTLGYNASYGIYIGGINSRYIYSGNSSYTGPVFYNGSAAYTIWHGGNLTDLNQLTNGPGYIVGLTFDGLTAKTGGTGTYTTTGDFRAPIFYNHTDTSYYVDPDSLSVMSRISLGYNSGEVNSIGCSNWFRSSGSTGWYNASYAGGIYMEDSTWVRVYNNKQFYSQNYIQSNSSIRAPYFYDSDNTQYYVDPASTSIMGRVAAYNGLYLNRSGTATTGISWYQSPSTATGWVDYMASVSVSGCGPGGNLTSPAAGSVVTSWALRSFVENNAGYGWTWESAAWGSNPSLVAQLSSNNGNFITTGNITAYSDIRVKTDIVKIENALDKVHKINGYTYTRTDTGEKQTGVIAQEVLKVLPEAVIGSEETQYAVAYGNMVGLLIEAIKEQQSEIDELKSLVKQLLAK